MSEEKLKLKSQFTVTKIEPVKQVTKKSSSKQPNILTQSQEYSLEGTSESEPSDLTNFKQQFGNKDLLTKGCGQSKTYNNVLAPISYEDHTAGDNISSDNSSPDNKKPARYQETKVKTNQSKKQDVTSPVEQPKQKAEKKKNFRHSLSRERKDRHYDDDDEPQLYTIKEWKEHKQKQEVNVKKKYNPESLKDIQPPKYRYIKSKIKKEMDAEKSHHNHQKKLEGVLVDHLHSLRAGDLQPSQFTISLQKCMGLGFQRKILPTLRMHQKRYQPQNSGLNRSPVLLRNTFNQELYRFFHTEDEEKEKTEKLQNSIKRQQTLIEDKQAGDDQEIEIENELFDDFNNGIKSNKQYAEYLRGQEKAMDDSKRQLIENHYQKVVKKQAQRSEQGKKELLQGQMRKNQLEMKIFKMEKGKTVKLLQQSIRSSDVYQKSVFNENEHAEKEIPSNVMLYENFIEACVLKQEKKAEKLENREEDSNKLLHIFLKEGFNPDRLKGYPPKQQQEIEKVFKRIQNYIRYSDIQQSIDNTTNGNFATSVARNNAEVIKMQKILKKQIQKQNIQSQGSQTARVSAVNNSTEYAPFQKGGSFNPFLSYQTSRDSNEEEGASLGNLIQSSARAPPQSSYVEVRQVFNTLKPGTGACKQQKPPATRAGDKHMVGTMARVVGARASLPQLASPLGQGQRNSRVLATANSSFAASPRNLVGGSKSKFDKQNLTREKFHASNYSIGDVHNDSVYSIHNEQNEDGVIELGANLQSQDSAFCTTNTANMTQRYRQPNPLTAASISRRCSGYKDCVNSQMTIQDDKLNDVMSKVQQRIQLKHQLKSKVYDGSITEEDLQKERHLVTRLRLDKLIENCSQDNKSFKPFQNYWKTQEQDREDKNPNTWLNQSGFAALRKPREAKLSALPHITEEAKFNVKMKKAEKQNIYEDIWLAAEQIQKNKTLVPAEISQVLNL